jgi:hypothetical protein
MVFTNNMFIDTRDKGIKTVMKITYHQHFKNHSRQMRAIDGASVEDSALQAGRSQVRRSQQGHTY